MRDIHIGKDYLVPICEVLGIDITRVARVIIDIPFNDVPIIYIEQIGDDRLLSIDWKGTIDKAVIKRG